MDKEGQDVQFSSNEIPNKSVPDYFVGSNENQTRKDPSKRTEDFFSNLKQEFVSYFKHPFAGQHKIFSIIAIAIVAVIALFLVLQFTVFAPKSRTMEKLSEADLDAWNNELNDIVNEGMKKSDEDLRTYYSNLIKNERHELKYNDLVIEYAKELINRGDLDNGMPLLEAIDKDILDCAQTVEYYLAYALSYFVVDPEGSSAEEYQNLANEQEERCNDEYPAIDLGPDAGNYKAQKQENQNETAK